ncbi:MAG: hypothetical protein U0W24_23500 [Bacteroidales bacterium]
MKFNIKTVFITLFSLCFTGYFGIAQKIRVKAKLDSTAITLGDQVWLTLSAEQEKVENVKFPVFKNKIIEGVDLLDVSDLDTQSTGNNKIIVTQKLLITAFDDSIFRLPAFLFMHNLDSLYTDSILLMVNDIRIDSTEFAKIDTSQYFTIFDVKSPINTPWTIKEFIQIYYPYLLGLLGIIILVLLVIYYLKQRAKNKPLIKLPEKPKEPAHIIALRALDDLKARKLWQSDNVKQYYSELTDILRAYIEARFDIHTFERTSHEILENIKHAVNLKPEIFSLLKHIFTYSDLAKFAKYRPLADENDLCLKYAYQFVENTAVTEKTNSGNENGENIQTIEANTSETILKQD